MYVIYNVFHGLIFIRLYKNNESFLTMNLHYVCVCMVCMYTSYVISRYIYIYICNIYSMLTGPVYKI